MHYTKSNSFFLWIYRIKTLPQKKTKQNGIQNIRLTDPCSKRKDTSKRLGDTINFLSKTSRSHKMSWIPVDSVSALAQFNWKIAITGYLHTGTFVCLLVSKVLMVFSSALRWVRLVFSSPTGRTMTTTIARVFLVSICGGIPALTGIIFGFWHLSDTLTHSCW